MASCKCHDKKWVYQSNIGEIEVWAKSIDEAIMILHNHGFRVNQSKLKEAVVNIEHEEVR